MCGSLSIVQPGILVKRELSQIFRKTLNVRDSARMVLMVEYRPEGRKIIWGLHNVRK